jgi:hypothetical protein
MSRQSIAGGELDVIGYPDDVFFGKILELLAISPLRGVQ